MNTNIWSHEYDEVSAVTDEINLHRINFLVGGVVTLLIVILFIWLGTIFIRPETMPIRNVRVEGEFRRLATEQLQTTVTNTIKGGFFNVNVEAIQKNLLRNPWVYQVTVRRIWPDSLNVKILEQTAIARWDEQGLINPYAEFFSVGRETIPENLPLFRGPDNSYRLLLEQYLYIKDKLSKHGLNISELILNERRAWSFVLDNGLKVILGRQSDITDKIDRFSIYVASDSKDHLAKMETVDMRYTNGFAVKWKQTGLIHHDLGQESHG